MALAAAAQGPPRPAPPRWAPVAPGTELAAGYHVIEHLNRGNRLDVYDAWSEERASRCVLKTLRPDRASDSAARSALRREGRLLLRSSHPHLVRAYELARARDDERPVLVLETLGGETLSHLIHRLDERGRRLAVAEVAMLGLQLASVLTYLHRQGWLHLDLKPSNIVAEAGRARLIDLSIVRRPGRAPAGVGTYEYLSPEQARGGQLTTAADVWGLGAVLYTALAAEPPFGYPEDDLTGPGAGREGDTTSHPADPGTTASWATTDEGADSLEGSAAVDGHAPYPQLMSDPVSVRRRRRLPAVLGGLVDACLDRDPGARPTLSEVSEALEAWLADRAAAPPSG